MSVHHCPRCELRFALRGDLVDHLRLDHPPATPEAAGPPPVDTRIMVPLDPARPPEHVVDVAASLATPGTIVELVAVEADGLPAVVVDAFLDAERDRHGSLRVEVRRLTGPDVVSALLARIASAQPDLVVLASHGRGPIGELILGSVSADLVRSSPVPTVLVGPACHPAAGIDRLVVGVDGSADSLGALDVASHLAARFDLEIELVEVTDEATPSGDVVESAELQRLARALEPPVRRWDVLHGSDVPRALVDHVDHDRGAALVLGTHGASPGRPSVLGSTATRTVRQAPVPVLVVSPEAASTVATRALITASS